MPRMPFALAAFLALAGHQAGAQEERDTIFQYSTLDALKAGVFDGGLTFGELAAHGDLGLGTFNALDGEMIGFDGSFWRITHDGTVHEVPPETPTPFAAVTPFEPDVAIEIEGGLDFKGLSRLLDGQLADRNTPVAVRIDGSFAKVTIRAPSRQSEPYGTLAEALADQAVWELGPVEGTMAGFWFPAWMGSLNAATWHLHFLSADRTRGGHVLDLETAEARVALDPSPGFHLVLMQTEPFLAADLDPGGQ